MDLESSLKNYLAMQASGGRRIPYLAVIHRLDQPVEGILVFGKTPEAAKSLSAQITAGKMEKIYLAVTYGKQAEASGYRASSPDPSSDGSCRNAFGR